MQWFQVQVTLDDFEDARALLRKLVGERITVSGTIVGPVVSIEWNRGLGVREILDRWLVLAMSTQGRVHDLMKRIREECGGESVELIVLPVSFGDGLYLDGLLTEQI